MPWPPDVPPEPAWLDADAAARLTAEERDALDDEVAERVRAEWATGTMGDRWRASLGRAVAVSLLGGHRLAGRVSEAGRGWVVVEAARGRLLVNGAAVVSAEGLAPDLVASDGAVASRLGPGRALRGLQRAGRPVRLLLVDGTTVEGSLLRVLADAVDLVRHPADRAPAAADPWVTLAWAAVAAVVPT